MTGGAKPFDPRRDDVDRIVDYATALESTLAPEKDYNTRRVSRRAAALTAPDNPAETEAIVRLIKRFYDIRSRVVHGSGLSGENRRAVLAGLYDPTDQDRGSFALDKFKEIKTVEVRKAIAAKIAQLAGD